METNLPVRSKMGMAGEYGNSAGALLPVTVDTRYKVECWRGVKVIEDITLTGRILKFLGLGSPTQYDYSNAQLVWVEDFKNLVVTTGRNKLLDATLVNGLASPTWYVGLKATGTALAADTMASHGGWAELGANTYSNVTRPAWTPGAISAGAVDNSASKAIFTINATQTVFGCFLTNNNTVDGTTGILYGAGDFVASRGVQSGDTLNVTVTPSIS